MATGEPAAAPKVKAFAAMFEVSGNDRATSPTKPVPASKPLGNRLTKPALADPGKPAVSTNNKGVDKNSDSSKLLSNRAPRNMNSSSTLGAQDASSSSDVKRLWQTGRVSNIKETSDPIPPSQSSVSNPHTMKAQSSKLNIPNVFQKNSEPEQRTSVQVPKTSPKPSIPFKSTSPLSNQISAVTKSPKPTNNASLCSDVAKNMSPQFQDARANISNFLSRNETAKFTFDSTAETVDKNTNSSDSEPLTFSIQETALGNANINDIPTMPKKTWTNKSLSSNKLNMNSNDNSFDFNKNILIGVNNKRYRRKAIIQSELGNSPLKPESLREQFDFSQIQCKTDDAAMAGCLQESSAKGSEITSVGLPPPPRPPRNDGMLQEQPRRTTHGQTQEESWPEPPAEAFREQGDGAEELEVYDDIAAVEQISRNRPLSNVSIIPEYSEEEETKDVVPEDDVQESFDDVAVPQLPARNPPAKNDSGGSFASIQETSSDCTTDKESAVDDELYEPLEEVQVNVTELKRQESEKKDKDSKRREKEQLKRVEKERKKGKENLIKFKLTGDEEAIAAGIARDISKGGKTDLAVKKLERVFIMRMTENPPGKWLVKNENGKLGYVNSQFIEVHTDGIRNVMDFNYQNMKKSFVGLSVSGDTASESSANTGQDETQEEDIYEETG